MNLPKRLLGQTGVQVSILGLGGEGILRTFGHEKEAHELINAAIDLGITYFESARAYSGSESYYGDALQDRRERDLPRKQVPRARQRGGPRSSGANT